MINDYSGLTSMVEKSTMTDQTALLIVFLCFVFGIGIGIFTCIYFSKKVRFYNYNRLLGHFLCPKFGTPNYHIIEIQVMKQDQYINSDPTPETLAIPKPKKPN